MQNENVVSPDDGWDGDGLGGWVLFHFIGGGRSKAGVSFFFGGMAENFDGRKFLLFAAGCFGWAFFA